MNDLDNPEGFLALRGLTKTYATLNAVDNLSLSIRKGELVAFLGPSGCGKTTSLRMIAGLVGATSGHVVVNGRDVTHIPTHKRDMGLVFQSYALFPHMGVAENLAFGLEMRKVPREEIDRRVKEALALVHLTGMENRRPAQLSGGQQQRVALARALVIHPSILLLDEPLSNLDAKLRDEMRTEIRDIQKRLGITAIFVTHDQVEALTMCDRVAVMNKGRLEQIGTPEDLYERPQTRFVATFVGRMNQLPCHFEGTGARVGNTVLRIGAARQGRGVVMVRPHRISLDALADPALNALPGKILRVTFAGDILQYDIEACGQTLQVEQATQSGLRPMQPGADVTVSWSIADTLAFGDE